MSFIVTGANGFIGKNLCEALGPDVKTCDVVGKFDIPSSKLKEAIMDIQPECVFHLGAISSTTESDIFKICENNILLSTKLFNVCSNLNIPLVYASSASIYGEGTQGFQEHVMTTPMNYYAISKDCFDRFVTKKVKDNPRLQVVGLRYFNVYGHNEDSKKDMASPVHKFLKSASKTKTIKLFKGSEKFYRDFVDIRDVVSLTVESQKFKSGIYNIGSGKARTFLEVAKIIKNLTNADIQYIDFPKHLEGKYQNYTCSDNGKINKVAKQKSRFSLAEGIRNVAITKGYIY